MKGVGASCGQGGLDVTGLRFACAVCGYDVFVLHSSAVCMFSKSVLFAVGSVWREGTSANNL